MKLIALKGCSFGGHVYFPGTEIPAGEVVDPARQEGLGVLVRVAEAEKEPASVTCQTGTATYTVTVEEMEHVLALVQKTPTEITKEIEAVTSVAELQVLAVVDRRKPVDQAIEARIAALGGDQE
ncbi:MAG TPA: hypothetical protein DHV42_01110 [Lachnospiraceae bacterium]|nr:hypothetical protein [Lachnospiraceae bacterium]